MNSLCHEPQAVRYPPEGSGRAHRSKQGKVGMRKGFFLVLGGLMVAATLADSGAARAAGAAGAWAAPAACGAEPAAPSVDVSSVEHYNASVDKVTAYEKAARAYNTCVARSANKEETAISNEAREKIAHIHEGSATVQKRIAANFVHLTASLKAASAKFGGGAH